MSDKATNEDPNRDSASESPESPESPAPAEAREHLVLVPRPPAQVNVVVSDALVDEVVAEINELERSAGVGYMVALGKIIIERFYRGDLSAWRYHGAKEASLRKLSGSEKLRVSATTLYRAIGIYELDLRFGVARWQHLSVSHLRTVLNLSELDQFELLTAAEDGEWLVEDLEAEAAPLRKSDRAGRPALPAFVKGIRKLGKMFAAREASFGTLDDLGNLGIAEITKLDSVLAKVMRECAAMRDAIATHVQEGERGQQE